MITLSITVIYFLTMSKIVYIDEEPISSKDNETFEEPISSKDNETFEEPISSKDNETFSKDEEDEIIEIMSLLRDPSFYAKCEEYDLQFSTSQ